LLRLWRTDDNYVRVPAKVKRREWFQSTNGILSLVCISSPVKRRSVEHQCEKCRNADIIGHQQASTKNETSKI
jgi:hypothetical protein